MSSAVVSTSAALGRPFVFDAKTAPEVSPADGRPPQRALATDPRLAAVTPASQLEASPSPEMASSGIPAIDALAGGWPRGCLTEICGSASSGRTTLLLSALAAATRRGEFCVVVDASDSLDPHSAASAGVELDRLLWVRCGEGSFQKDSPHNSAKQNSRDKIGDSASRPGERRLEQVLRATDSLLESGGFGLIVLDLGDLPPQTARRIPLTTWFRFRRAVEHTPTVLLVVEEHAIAGSCSSLLLQLGPQAECVADRDSHLLNSGYRDESVAKERTTLPLAGQIPFEFPYPAHAQLLTGLDITAERMRSRHYRKPSRSASAAFASKTAWAG
jgi:hypothetical protein